MTRTSVLPVVGFGSLKSSRRHILPPGERARGGEKSADLRTHRSVFAAYPRDQRAQARGFVRCSAEMNIFRLAGDMTHLMSVLVLLLKIHTIKSCAGKFYPYSSFNPVRIWFRFGISLKTQELYALVFATRYLDIFTDFISVYNTIMKLIFLGSSFSIVLYIRRHKIVRRSYDKDQDTFRHFFLVLPCLLLALVINEKFTLKEVMWTFSLFLEAVAILPQLVLLQRTKNIDNLTGQYVFLLGLRVKVGLKWKQHARWYCKEKECCQWGYAKILFFGTIAIEDRRINSGYDCVAYRAFYILNWIYRYFTEPHYVHWITWISGLVQTLLYADFFYYYFNSLISFAVGRTMLSSSYQHNFVTSRPTVVGSSRMNLEGFTTVKHVLLLAVLKHHKLVKLNSIEMFLFALNPPH
ncbi:hypothetical protein ZIOFF_034258 [Zingiber officinale]|uniref:ER lumen protein-retaining receptor n=1 Tax=Zingiber officinale TaxID=94328 RepID=A0A8J5GLG4_ZINOF|nr:hypothetical protein ZIOFF_034258 [Zingiber officinale]